MKSEVILEQDTDLAIHEMLNLNAAVVAGDDEFLARAEELMHERWGQDKQHANLWVKVQLQEQGRIPDAGIVYSYLLSNDYSGVGYLVQPEYRKDQRLVNIGLTLAAFNSARLNDETFGNRYEFNSLRNAPLLPDTVDPRFASSRINSTHTIVWCAGPSTDDVLAEVAASPALRAKVARCVNIVCDSALPAVIEAGIPIAVVCTIDGQPVKRKMLTASALAKADFVMACQHVDAEVPRRTSLDKLVIIPDVGGAVGRWYKTAPVNRTDLEQRNVGHFAYHMATRWWPWAKCLVVGADCTVGHCDGYNPDVEHVGRDVPIEIDGICTSGGMLQSEAVWVSLASNNPRVWSASSSPVDWSKVYDEREKKWKSRQVKLGEFLSEDERPALTWASTTLPKLGHADRLQLDRLALELAALASAASNPDRPFSDVATLMAAHPEAYEVVHNLVACDWVSATDEMRSSRRADYQGDRQEAVATYEAAIRALTVKGTNYAMEILQGGSDAEN